MSTLNGNGNGLINWHGGLLAPKPELTPTQTNALISKTTDTQAVFQTAAGMELRGQLLHIERHALVFELYNPHTSPQVSETLNQFQVIFQRQIIYSGHAVAQSVLDAGTKLVCKVVLNEASWLDSPPAEGVIAQAAWRNGFDKFTRGWQKSFVIMPEYKLLVTDLQVFFGDLRLWLDRVEASINGASKAERSGLATQAAQELRAPVLSALGNLFARFESICNQIPAEQQANHRAFGQRFLHPYMMCAPFTHRTFTKPLGYAGDYEMMNMIVRNGFEGRSLFAKLIHSFQVDQAPARAVRGRVNFLTAKIAGETGRLALSGKPADIFCVACGPAWEATNFIADHPLADQARFCLLDFNEETLQHTGQKVDEVRRKSGRRTPVRLVKNSVQNLLRAGARATRQPAEYDLIYCSGLYDYLNDATCKSLNTHLFDLLRPGGLLVVGNFAPTTPIQNFMGHLLEWFLIYRDAKEILALAPEQVEPAACTIRSEPSGTNFFLEVRKPE